MVHDLLAAAAAGEHVGARASVDVGQQSCAGWLRGRESWHLFPSNYKNIFFRL